MPTTRRTTRKNVARRRRSTRRRPATTRTYRARKNFSAKRAPMVETKKRESGESSVYLSATSPGQTVFLRSFMFMNQGIGKSEFLGDSVFSKYIKMKLLFRFPRDEYSIRKNYRIQLIHGWVTSPYALTNTAGTQYAPIRGSVTSTELETILASKIADSFNAPGDELAFREKEKKIYKIEGKQWLTPDRNGQIGFAQQFGRYAAETDHLIGGIPDIKRSLTWKPMRKVALDLSQPNGEAAFHFPNQAWVPFVHIYCPEFGNVASTTNTAYHVQLRANDCHWYTDS